MKVKHLFKLFNLQALLTQIFRHQIDSKSWKPWFPS